MNDWHKFQIRAGPGAEDKGGECSMVLGSLQCGHSELGSHFIGTDQTEYTALTEEDKEILRAVIDKFGSKSKDSILLEPIINNFINQSHLYIFI